MNRIPIALFANRSEAEPIQQRLARAGVDAEIQDELMLQKLWFVSKAAAGARLAVAAEHFEQAEKLLLAWDLADGALKQAIRCPECKSFRVDYPQFARNSVMTNMAAGVAAELGLVEKDYYCQKCHYTWPKEPNARARKRPHMAPYYFIEDIGNSASPKASQRPSRNGPGQPG
jgi:predicted Zn-ribbon and HTH transcriptional regulator